MLIFENGTERFDGFETGKPQRESGSVQVEGGIVHERKLWNGVPRNKESQPAREQSCEYFLMKIRQKIPRLRIEKEAQKET